ncbi:MAG: PEGA domain-containing protein [Candidatus Aminicenantes bacterium]|nr:PEGA domain-containing protein [Candidatus Aminicenantes bacterium]
MFLSRGNIIHYFLFPLLFFFIFSYAFSGEHVVPDKFRPVVKVRNAGRQTSPARQEEFDKLLAEGRRLYLEEMDYEAAVAKLKEAEDAAQTIQQKASVFLYLSLSYYASGGERDNPDFEQALGRLIVYDYYRELDKQLCPPRYIELFQEKKREYGALRIESDPSGAEVYIVGEKGTVGVTPLVVGHKEGRASVRVKLDSVEKSETLEVVAGEEKTVPRFKLKKRSPLGYILGGAAAIAGGVTAYLLLKPQREPEGPTGNIIVYSEPKGATVYLDGANTGQITDCTLSDVEVGSHTVKLVKEGYVDYEKAVNVSENATETISASLIQHTLTVTAPTSDDIAVMGKIIDITWETGQEELLSVDYGLLPGNNPDALFSQRSSLISGHSFRRFLREKGIAGSMLGSTVRQGRPYFDEIRLPGKENPGLNPFPEKMPSFQPLRLRSAKNQGVHRTEPFSRLKKSQLPFRGRSLEISLSNEDKPMTLSDVKIQLFQGTILVETIASSTSNSGTYSWTVPKTLSENKEYKIKVSCTDEPGICDESETFMITYGYKYLLGWEGHNGSFNNPIGIAVSGYVYVVDNWNHRVQKFTADGGFVKEWGSFGFGDEQFHYPRCVAIDSFGDVYVTDSNNHHVKKFTSNGEFILKWSIRDETGEEAGNEYAITIDSGNNVYITDVDTGNNKYSSVHKFTSNGSFLKKWGTYGSQNGEFLNPMGITAHPNGRIYVADTDNNRVQVFTSSGTFIKKFGSSGFDKGEFNKPRAIDVDKDGYLYIADSGNNRIQKFDADGNFIMKFGEGVDAQFNNPQGIAVDESENIYIVDTDNNRVQKFGPDIETAAVMGGSPPGKIQAEQKLNRAKSSSRSEQKRAQKKVQKKTK